METKPPTSYQATLLDCRSDLMTALGRIQAMDRRSRERAQRLTNDLQSARLRIDAEFDRPGLRLAK